jgi:hypothetical protein
MVYPQRNERPLLLFSRWRASGSVRGSLFRRHSGERLHAVIPAKAGIHFDFVFCVVGALRENRRTSV